VAVLIWNGGANVIGRAFPARSQATAIGVFTSGATAGFAVGQVTGPVVAATFGWTAVFVAYGLAGLLPLAAFAALTLRSPLELSGGETPQIGDFRRVLTNPGVWAVGVMGFSATSLYLILNSWLPTYLTEVLEYPLVTGGLVVGVLPAVGILARSSSGLVSDRLFGGRRRPVLLSSFVVSTPLVVAFVFTDYLPALILVLAFVGFFVQLGPGIFVVQARETVDANVSATAISFVTSLTALGAFAGPILAGYVIELTGTYTLAFGCAAALGLVGLVIAWRLTDSGPHSGAHRESPGD
ncbi:MAG: MFS transporter, partial [Halobacteriales archaeon]|nr:MFS transporter [Halobacteriales archaeon]